VECERYVERIPFGSVDVSRPLKDLRLDPLQVFYEILRALEPYVYIYMQEYEVVLIKLEERENTVHYEALARFPGKVDIHVVAEIDKRDGRATGVVAVYFEC